MIKTFTLLEVLLGFQYYTAKAVGLSYFTLHFSPLQAQVTKRAVFYSILVNSVTVTILVFNGLTNAPVEYIKDKTLTTVVMFVNSGITLFTFFGIILVQFLYRHKVVLLLNTYIKFANYIIKWTNEKCFNQSFLVLVIVKTLIPYNQLAGSICVMFLVKLNTLPLFVSMLFTSTVITQVITLAVNVHYFALLYIAQIERAIDNKLIKDLTRLLNCKTNIRILRSCDICDEIDHISYLKSFLRVLSLQTENTFKLQKIFAFSYWVSETILKCFMFYYLVLSVKGIHIGIILGVTETLMICVVDFLLFIVAADTVNGNNAKRRNHFNINTITIESMDIRLEKSIEVLSLQSLLKTTTVNLCAANSLNKDFGFRMLSGFLAYLIILIQFDKVS